MPDLTCSVADCERSGHARGLCQRHYVRLRKHGDPLVNLRNPSPAVEGRKICRKCGESLSAIEFHGDSASPDGLRSQCKSCRSDYMVGYHEANTERVKAYQRKRRVEQAETVRAIDRARYVRDKDKRVAAASDGVRLRRARIAGVGSDPKLTTGRLREIHGDACCYCSVQMDFERGKRGEGIAPNRATLEHILPISRGGTHTFDNAALACHRCNVSKNSKTVAEWEAWKVGDFGVRQEAIASGAGS